jgi:putative transposase
MKKSKFTESQIVFALQQAESGVTVAEVCRKLGISEATFYSGKKKFSGLGPVDLRRLRQLEEENAQLKRGSRSGARLRPYSCIARSITIWTSRATIAPCDSA